MNTPCWLWQGWINDRTGYGTLRWKGRVVNAHRWAWEMWHNKPVPPGLFVLHHCDVRACIAPDHLYIGTPRQNAQDASKRGRLWMNQRTHCPRGHLYGPPHRDGRRRCKECKRA